MTQDFKSFFADVGGGEGERCNYTKRLDTYGCGCSHNCAYCYSRSLLDFRGLWNPENPRVASHVEIARRLSGVEPGEILRLGGMTDCFQPIEKKLGVTATAISLMNKKGIGYLIVTKSDLIADDRYMRAMKKDLAHIQVTVTSTSDEPNFLRECATPPSKRIKAAERLQEEGFDVSIRVSPYVPELIDLDKLNAVKVDKVLVEFLRVNHWIEKWTGRSWPEHTVKSGGYRHLPIRKKIKLLEGFDFPQMTVCEDVPWHYEWFRDNFNADAEDCCNLRKSASWSNGA